MEQMSPLLQARLEQHKLNQANNNYATQPKVDIGGTKLEQLDKDTVSLSSNNNGKFDYSIDDGKISFGDKLKNFGKGLITPITALFSSPKNFLIGAGIIAAGTALTIATGGAIAPLFVALGVTGGAIQLGTSIIKAHNATTDDEAKSAWLGMGAATSAVGMSVLGSKAALKGAGVDTKGMSFLKATLECFRQVPSSVSKSVGAFTSGQALTNIKNVFKPKKSTNSETNTESKTETSSEPKTENNTKAKTENSTETKPDTKAEPKTEPKTEQNIEPKPETKVEAQTEQPKAPEVNETACETKAEPKQEISKATAKPKSETPEVKSEIKEPTAEVRTNQSKVTETKVEPVAKEPTATEPKVELKSEPKVEPKPQPTKPQTENNSLVQKIVQKDGTKITLTRDENGQIIESVITKPDKTTITKTYKNGKCCNSSQVKFSNGTYYINETVFKYNNDGKISQIQNGDFRKIFNYDQNGKFSGYTVQDYPSNIVRVYNNKEGYTDTVSDFSGEIENAINELNSKYQFDKNMVIKGKTVARKTTVLDKQTGEVVNAYITQDHNGGFSIYVENAGKYENIGSVTVNTSETGTIHGIEREYYDIKNLYGSQSQKIDRYRGAGTELLKQCSIDSYNNGKNGTFGLRSGNWMSDGFYRHIGLYGHQGWFELPECSVSSFLLR